MKRSLESDNNNSSDTDSENEEEEQEDPRIQDVLRQISNAVPYQAAQDLLHSMAASKDILFWSPSGEMMRNKRRIPKTVFSDLVEFVLLPYHKDIPVPKGFNMFLEGLAELGVEKKLIRNKEALSDLIMYENNQQSSDEEEEEKESSQSSEDEPEQSSEEEEETEQSSNEDEDEDSNEDGEQEVKGSVDLARCRKCLWHDAIPGGFKKGKLYQCPICQNQSHLRNVTIAE